MKRSNRKPKFLSISLIPQCLFMSSKKMCWKIHKNSHRKLFAKLGIQKKREKLSIVTCSLLNVLMLIGIGIGLVFGI